MELDVEVARWLTSAAGRRRVAEVTARLDDGDDPLRLAGRLDRDGLAPAQRSAVLGAAEARRRARPAWPDADALLFAPTALEQASDPAVAAWRARRFTGRRVVDLGAGLGADALALARVADSVTAVDWQEGRLVLLAANAATLGLTVQTVVADATSWPVAPDDTVHADPGRRRQGRRLRRLADLQPPVPALLPALRTARGAGLVLSPAVDLDDPDLPAGELEFIGDPLREAVVWCGDLARPQVAATATLLDPAEGRSEDSSDGSSDGSSNGSSDGAPASTRHRSGPVAPLPVGPIGSHLVEVAPSAVRARLHDEVGREIGARRVARRHALLTTDHAPPPSPWYRALTVEAVLPCRPVVVRRWLRTQEPRPVELATHGVDADLAAWWRGIGSPQRGPQGRRITLLRLDDRAVAVVTGNPPGRKATSALPG